MEGIREEDIINEDIKEEESEEGERENEREDDQSHINLESQKLQRTERLIVGPSPSLNPSPSSVFLFVFLPLYLSLTVQSGISQGSISGNVVDAAATGNSLFLLTTEEDGAQVGGRKKPTTYIGRSLKKCPGERHIVEPRGFFYLKEQIF